jgi:hypothetical protein
MSSRTEAEGSVRDLTKRLQRHGGGALLRVEAVGAVPFAAGALRSVVRSLTRHRGVRDDMAF